MMRLSVLLLLLATGLVGPASGEDATEKDSSREEGAVFSEALTDFLDNAVDGGVLRRPAGTQDQVSSSPVKQAAIPVGEELLQAPARVCSSTSPLDFQAGMAVNTYADLAPLLAVLNTKGPKFDDVQDLIKGYFTLGLFAEAQAVLRGHKEPDALYVSALATLLEHRSVTDIGVFADQANCHVDAEIWHAIAQIMSGDPVGTAQIAEQIAALRALPVRMRVHAAEIALPALRAKGDTLTASKIVSTFSMEDQEISSRLQFQIALFEALKSGQDYPQQADQILAQSSSVMDMLRPVMTGQRRASEPELAILLERIDDALAGASNDQETALIVSFALREYSKRSDYRAIIGLLDHPVLSGGGAQGEVLDQLISLIRRDLETGRPELALKSASLLIEEASRLSGHPTYGELLKLAANAAMERNNQAVAATILTRAGNDQDALGLRGNYALRKGDHDALYQMADGNLGHAELIWLASLAAIRTGDGTKLRKYLALQQLDQDKRVTLIEEDAIARHWIVPGATYQSALNEADGAVLNRLEKINSLRLSAAGAPVVPTPTNISAALAKTSLTQAELDERAL